VTPIGIARDADRRVPAVTGRRSSSNSSVADRRPAVTGRRSRAGGVPAPPPPLPSSPPRLSPVVMASSTDAPPSRDAPPSQVSQTNSGGGAYKRRDEEVNEGGEREPAGRPRRLPAALPLNLVHFCCKFRVWFHSSLLEFGRYLHLADTGKIISNGRVGRT